MNKEPVYARSLLKPKQCPQCLSGFASKTRKLPIFTPLLISWIQIIINQQETFNFSSYILGITVVLPIENKMSDPEAMTSTFGIVNIGLTLITIFYFAMAFFGYLQFGQESLGSITLNLPHDSLYGR